jgi:hypothetical protein
MSDIEETEMNEEEHRNDIVPEDIIYQDENVCILKPHVKKGIIVFSNYESNNFDISKVGLKSGLQLYKEGIDFGRVVQHPYIFFRAPYYSLKKIDYSSIETEIASLYGNDQIHIKNTAYIRVNPRNTFVYSSEIRVEYCNKLTSYIDNSRKRLSSYLYIINQNKIMEDNIPLDRQIFYNLFSSEACYFILDAHPHKPYNDLPINRNSEILVTNPHLTPDYFVLIK